MVHRRRGGTDEQAALKTILGALEHGITLLDTAPVYGLGRAEEFVGRALAQYGKRQEVLIATKVGLEWRGEQVFRNSSRARIMKEINESLRHWPDPLVPIEETATAMHQLYKQGKIRAIGVSNQSLEQMKRISASGPAPHSAPTLQPDADCGCHWLETGSGCVESYQ